MGTAKRKRINRMRKRQVARRIKDFRTRTLKDVTAMLYPFGFHCVFEGHQYKSNVFEYGDCICARCGQVKPEKGKESGSYNRIVK